MNKDKDFILKDKIFKVLMRLSYPLIFSNIIATMYTLADGVWLAQLSASQFTATSFTWPIVFLFISVAIGISIAGTALISRFIGSKDREKASDYAKHLLIISIFLGTFFSVLGYLITPKIVELMGATGELYEYSVIYLKVHSVGFIFDTLYFSVSAILNAQGKTKITTLMGIVSGGLNIVLDSIFIFTVIPFVNITGFGWGIFGAAFASVLAKLIALFIGFSNIYFDTTYIDIRFKKFSYKTNITKHILNMAIPTAFGRSSAALGFTALNMFIISYGQEVVAAFSIVNRITDFFMQISMGISAAMTTIIGQNLGAKQYDRVKESIKDSRNIVLLTSAIGMIGLYVFQNQILGIFVDPIKDKVIFDITKEYMFYDIFMVPFVGLFNVYQGLFQGLGEMKYSMHMSLGRLWILRIPMIVVFKNFTDIGRSGIWICMLISNVLIVLYSHYIYSKKYYRG